MTKPTTEAAPRATDGLTKALQRFLDAETAIEDFEDRSEADFAATGEQADDEQAGALLRERLLALASLRDYDPLNGIYGRAAIRLAAPRPEPLDVAWAAAEAALPEGWGIGTLRLGRHYPPGPEVEWVVWAMERYPDYLLPRNDRTMFGRGPTPAAALLALAAALAPSEPTDG